MNEQQFTEIRDRRYQNRSLAAADIDITALLAEVDRLHEERHTTNEALSIAAEAIRVKDQRIAELESARPSRFSATPLQVDVFLRTVLAEDTYLRYQQAIGSEAVREAMGDAQSFRNCDDNAQMKQAWRSGIDDALGYIDPDGDGGPYPSQLLCSQHSGGLGPCPGAPKCTPNQGGAL